MLRRPRTVNSLPMMMTTIQAGTRCMSTSETNAAEIKSLSAMGSRRMPRVVICRRRRAKYPSAQSVAAAKSKIRTPQTSKCTEKPQNSKLGLRVRRITMRTGTKKIRNSVSELGRFMANDGAGAAPWHQPPQFHYRLGVGRRQHAKGGFALIMGELMHRAFWHF